MLAPKPNAYLRTKILTAPPEELRLMLLDGAIRFLEHGRDGLERKDFEAVYNGISRCQAIIMELMNALQPEHDRELCAKLSGLYTFMYMRLITASSERSVEAADEVLGLLRYERETWTMLLDQVAKEKIATAAAASATADEPAHVSLRG
jgi:flagellar protein FliS